MDSDIETAADNLSNHFKFVQSPHFTYYMKGFLRAVNTQQLETRYEAY